MILKGIYKNLSTKQKYFRKGFLFLCAVLVLPACSSDKLRDRNKKAGSNRLIIEGSDEEAKSNAELNADAIRDPKLAFKITMHNFLQEKCGGCHATSITPFIASSDLETAFKETYENKKINPLVIERSRIILRLDPEQHNCWTTNCGKDAEEMKANITKWIGLINDGTIEKLREEAFKFLTAEKTFSEIVTKDNPELNYNPQQMVFEAENVESISGNLEIKDFENASGGKALEVMSLNSGIAEYKFTIKEPGTYTVFGLTNNDSTRNMTVTVSVDTSPNQTWQIAPNGADTWEWTRAGRATNLVSIDLDVGEHILKLSGVSQGFKIDALAITTDLDFKGAVVPPKKVDVLDFDLSELKGANFTKGTILEIQVNQFDENSYILKQPTIYLPSGTISLKGIRILLNGVWNAQNSTYLDINEEVSSPFKVLSSASLIMPADLGPAEDRISVQFEDIK
ncbi:MAG: hypothetical protein R3B45_09930 [Bdellovibrionota bacterium]